MDFWRIFLRRNGAQRSYLPLITTPLCSTLEGKVAGMIGNNNEYDEFISNHCWGVLTTLRKTGTPSSSMVAYARDGDELVVSTPGTTFKTSSIRADARVSFCVISNQEPFNFVTIEGTATVETEELVANTKKVFANIVGTGFPEPEDLQGWLTSQQRVILRIHPQRISGVIR